ncbi:MAG: DUF4445 domain-containing protein [Ruminococcaceae bacterium]|nr:DUF4445 domain-containing protein [Oscillospiraceae bacterium]
MSENIIHIPVSAKGMKLSEWLAENGYPVHADCGGRGKCGKCRVRVLDGSFADAETGETMEVGADGWILSCRAVCTEEAQIGLPENSGEGLVNFAADSKKITQSAAPSGIRYGVALDVGTTTLAAALVNMESGEILDTASGLNPQKSFGADVMSRISACAEGHLDSLQKLIINAANALIDKLVKDREILFVDMLTVAGNPTMAHLFCGVSPEGMGAYPFMPAFTEMKKLDGAELGLHAARVIVLPSASAFIGGDVIAGVLESGMLDEEEPTVIMDVGTNGEMILHTGLSHGGELIAVSTAAGPAMEGAGISCGVGGIPGAISAVHLGKDDRLTLKTIGDQPPLGVCGSGLIDLVAALLMRGDVDETGFVEDEPVTVAEADDHHEEIALTQADVRAFQLAKSALRAGLEALCADHGLEASELSKLYLAGGLGYYMDINSAVTVGLLPEELGVRVKTVGNTALAGAITCLTDEKAIGKLSRIAAGIRTVELNQSKTFNEGFIEYMMFPEEE